jgi:uncharacterized protein
VALLQPRLHNGVAGADRIESTDAEPAAVTSTKSTAARGPTPHCPICGRAAKEQHRPFCSARCADIDLSRWLSGSYGLTAAPDDLETGEEAGNHTG